MSNDELNTGSNMPINELDFNYKLTQPAWGREVTEELNALLVEAGLIPAEEGEGLEIDTKHLWGLLSYYTRDMRLSNLSSDLFRYCEHYLNLAGDCLSLGYIQSFLTGLKRVITVLELAQSRGGFLRKRQGTITSEQFKTEVDPAKRSLFGTKKKQEGL